MNRDVFDSARISALDPASPGARAIADLSWWMIGGFSAVFVLVMLLTFFAIYSKGRGLRQQVPWGNHRFIFFGGVVFPSVVVGALLLLSLALTSTARSGPTDLLIRVTGHMWWWDVEYPEHDIRIANELYIPVGRRVRVELLAKDVIHSFWVPNLAGKMDMIPGLRNELILEASEAGVFRGQCAELCGLQHAKMAFFVIALDGQEFEDWLRARRAAIDKIPSLVLQKGFEVFERAHCGECHFVRDTGAQAKIGPDLTHVGSRLSLGAGSIPNTEGNLAGWIANPQAIKPGNHMPRAFISPEDLHELTQFLRNLE